MSKDAYITFSKDRPEPFGFCILTPKREYYFVVNVEENYLKLMNMFYNLKIKMSSKNDKLADSSVHKTFQTLTGEENDSSEEIRLYDMLVFPEVFDVQQNFDEEKKQKIIEYKFNEFETSGIGRSGSGVDLTKKSNDTEQEVKKEKEKSESDKKKVKIKKEKVNQENGDSKENSKDDSERKNSLKPNSSSKKSLKADRKTSQEVKVSESPPVQKQQGSATSLEKSSEEVKKPQTPIPKILKSSDLGLPPVANSKEPESDKAENPKNTNDDDRIQDIDESEMVPQTHIQNPLTNSASHFNVPSIVHSNKNLAESQEQSSHPVESLKLIPPSKKDLEKSDELRKSGEGKPMRRPGSSKRLSAVRLQPKLTIPSANQNSNSQASASHLPEASAQPSAEPVQPPKIELKKKEVESLESDNSDSDDSENREQEDDVNKVSREKNSDSENDNEWAKSQVIPKPDPTGVSSKLKLKPLHYNSNESDDWDLGETPLKPNKAYAAAGQPETHSAFAAPTKLVKMRVPVSSNNLNAEIPAQGSKISLLKKPAVQQDFSDDNSWD